MSRRILFFGLGLMFLWSSMPVTGQPDCHGLLPQLESITVQNAEDVVGLAALESHSLYPIFTPDDQFLMTVDTYPLAWLPLPGFARIEVWNLSNLQVEFRIELDDASILNMDYHPASEQIAFADEYGTIYLADFVTGEINQTIITTGLPIQELAFLPDGESIIAVLSNHDVLVYHIDPFAEQHVATLAGETAGILFLDDIMIVATASRLFLWYQLQFETPPQIIDVPQDIVSISGLPAQNRFVTVSEQIIDLWSIEIADGQFTLTTEDLIIRDNQDEPFITAAFNSDGSVLAIATSTNDIQLWDVAGQTLLNTIPRVSAINAIVFSPNDELLTVGSVGALELLGVSLGCEG